MRHKSGSDDEYADFAGVYDLLTGPPLLSLRQELVRAALDGWTGQGVFLDVCCGTGAQCGLLRKAGMACLGTDLSPSMLARARIQRPDVPFVLADAGRLPFGDGSFPAAGLTLALHEKPHPVRLAILSEMRRVLTAQGRMFIADYAPSAHGLAGWAIGRGIAAVERAAGREHHRLFRDFLGRGGLSVILEEAGLSVLSVRFLAKGNMLLAECR